MFTTDELIKMCEAKGIDVASLPDLKHDTMMEAILSASGGERKYYCQDGSLCTYPDYRTVMSDVALVQEAVDAYFSGSMYIMITGSPYPQRPLGFRLSNSGTYVEIVYYNPAGSLIGATIGEKEIVEPMIAAYAPA